MRCHEFLDHYSDYRDGLITDPAVHHALRRHLMECPRCLRYDVRIARGALLLRTAGEIEPSRRLRRRLGRRLAAASVDAEPVVPGRAGLMVALMLAAGLVLVLWQTARGPEQREARRPVPRSIPAVLANPGVPFVTITDLALPAFGADWRAPGAARAAAATWGELAP